jgi:hypothetical protein
MVVHVVQTAEFPDQPQNFGPVGARFGGEQGIELELVRGGEIGEMGHALFIAIVIYGPAVGRKGRPPQQGGTTHRKDTAHNRTHICQLLEEAFSE